MDAILTRACLVAGVVAISLSFPARAPGQATGLIVGVVQDGSGAVVPAAEVKAVNVLTGISATASTDQQGRFNFPRTPRGSYQVEVRAEGFRTFVSEIFALEADQNRRVTAVMEIGQVSEVVTVEGSVTRVDTESATLSEIVDERRITELPLNGRNPIDLVKLVPGVNNAPGGVISQFGAFSVNGARAISNNYMLDGGDNNDIQGGAPAIVPNPDALEEFSIQTNSFGAEHGGAMGGVVNAVTKSGTNELHGSAFNFLRNNVLDAPSFDANRSGTAVDKGKLRRNQFGATVGGPIVKNKTFFLVSYEGTRERAGAARFHNVPTDMERQADFTLSNNKPVDPDTGAAFANAVIPQTRWSPVSPRYLDALIPRANTLTTRPNGTVFGRVAFNRPSEPDRDQIIGRVDHQITDKQRGTFRLFHNVDNVFSSANVPTLTQNEGFDNWNIQGSHTWTLSPTLLGVGRYTWNEVQSARAGNPVIIDGEIATYETLGVNTPRGAPFSPEEQAVTWRGNVAGFWNLGQVNVLDTERQTHQAVYDMSWTRGAHMVKFGGEYRWSKSDRLTNNRVDPQFSFNGFQSTNALGDFFLGLPNRFQMGSQRLNRIRNLGTNFYVQDDWKIRSNLTLNIGVRYEPYHMFYSADDELTVFQPGVQSQIFPDAPPGALYVGDPGVPRTGAPKDWNNFAPRFGFAWQPFGHSRTSVRGGYGIFYDMPPFHQMSQFVNNPPFSMQFDRRQAELAESGATFADPFRGVANPFPFMPPATDAERAAFEFEPPIFFGQSVDPDLQAGYNQQWNFNIQQQLPFDIIWTGAYIGSKSQFLPYVMNLNLRPALSTGLPNVRPYPSFSDVRQYKSVAYGSYHAFQTTVNKRMSRGFTVLAHYTWGRTIDVSAQEGEPAAPQSINNLAAEKGLADFHRKHRVVASFVWDVPSPFQSGAGHWILGGWQANGIYTIQSGTPVNTRTNQDIARTTQGGGQRPDLTGDPLAGVNRDRQNIVNGGLWYNTAAFAVPERGFFGTAGRNIIVGPGNWNMDLGLFKNVNIGERLKVQYRWEMFNAFNHANLTNPQGVITANNAGEIQTLSGPRIMQMGLRLTF
jgi:hypothetical protein